MKKKIKKQKIPVIGHNCLIDFLFIFDNFEEKIEKLTKNEFKQNINKNLFSLIYDTKLLSMDLKLQTLPLGVLYERIIQNPKFKYKGIFTDTE